MPWGKPHTFTCIEPGCRKKFTSVAINPLRCPACRKPHNSARIKELYRKRRGKLFGKRPSNKPLSEEARFNLWLAKTWKNASCPICRKHMSQCRCCEPEVNQVEPQQVAMWKPWR